MKKIYVMPTVEVVDMDIQDSLMLTGSAVYESDAVDEVLSRYHDEFDFEDE